MISSLKNFAIQYFSFSEICAILQDAESLMKNVCSGNTSLEDALKSPILNEIQMKVEMWKEKLKDFRCVIAVCTYKWAPIMWISQSVCHIKQCYYVNAIYYEPCQ